MLISCLFVPSGGFAEKTTHPLILSKNRAKGTVSRQRRGQLELQRHTRELARGSHARRHDHAMTKAKEGAGNEVSRPCLSDDCAMLTFVDGSFEDSSLVFWAIFRASLSIPTL